MTRLNPPRVAPRTRSHRPARSKAVLAALTTATVMAAASALARVHTTAADETNAAVALKPSRPLPIPESTYATPGLTARMVGYFQAKSEPDLEGVMSYYSRTRTSHNDAVLGWVLPDWQTLYDLFATSMPNFGTGVSYATRVLGDERSAIVYMVDTPELFGGEILAISAFDFDDEGKISRVNDYWDARNFGVEKADTMKVPADQFPDTFGEQGLPNRAAPELQRLVAQLHAALRTGRIADVERLLSDDVVFEDFALRTQVRGKAAVTRYFERAITTLPYGPGAGIRHMVGSARGGGYEWTNTAHPVKRGITALALGEDGRIAQISTVYDASLLRDGALLAAQRRVLDFGHK